MADYISREAAIEALENTDADVCEQYPDGYCDWGIGRAAIKTMLKNVPAADVEPVRQWFRADVREPEADEYVLAIVSGEPTPHEVLENGYALAMVTNDGWMLPEWPEWRNADVHYWMSLPEPPEEGGNENAAD